MCILVQTSVHWADQSRKERGAQESRCVCAAGSLAVIGRKGLVKWFRDDISIHGHTYMINENNLVRVDVPDSSCNALLPGYFPDTHLVQKLGRTPAVVACQQSATSSIA